MEGSIRNHGGSSSSRPAKRQRTVLNSTDGASAGVGSSRGQTATGSGNDAPAMDSVDLTVFMNSLQREMGDLHRSIKASKDSRVEKAFQRVPRGMRRRTASHNAKRLPRRLRQQARRDQAADNTPSVAAGLAKRKKGRSSSAWVYEKTKQRVRLQQEKKLARGQATALEPQPPQGDAFDEMELDGGEPDDMEPRQTSRPPPAGTLLTMDRLRLPTHLWLAKRAHMTCPGPLWHTILAKTPANKTYRASLRSAGMRPHMCLCWDTSYMGVIRLQGPARQVDEALAAVVEPGLLSPALRSGSCCIDAQLPRSFAYQQHWTTATATNTTERLGQGRMAGPGNCGAMTVFYDQVDPVDLRGGDEERKTSAFLRVHPTIFTYVWSVLMAAVADKKLSVFVQDFRMEVGSIEITGSSAADALLSLLRPISPSMEPQAADFENLRRFDTTALAPASGTVLAFDVHDPRYDYEEPQPGADNGSDATGQPRRPSGLLLNWPSTKGGRPSGLFDDTRRQQATWLSSQQSLDRRRGKLPAGHKLLPTPSDHPIPVILAVAGASVPVDASSLSRANSISSTSPSWTLLAPRGCIDVLWRYLHAHCLGSGGRRPLLAGLDEERAVALERGRPWFPADFPGSPAGWNWELESRRTAEQAWNKTPPAKRTQWTTLDLGSSSSSGGSGSGQKRGELGSGFACDWEHVFGVDPVPAAVLLNGQDADSPHSLEEVQFAALRPDSMPPIVRGMYHVTWADLRAACDALQLPSVQRQPHWRTPFPLATILVEMVGRGTPLTRARIYRLPSARTKAGADLRGRWLVLAHEQQHPGSKPSNKMRRIPPDTDMETSKKLVVQSLLTTKLPYPPEKHLPAPDSNDIIGFVTSGAQCFQIGQGSGIGHVNAQKLVEAMVEAHQSSCSNKGNVQNVKTTRLCIVRNVGESVAWLARWTVLSN